MSRQSDSSPADAGRRCLHCLSGAALAAGVVVALGISPAMAGVTVTTASPSVVRGEALGVKAVVKGGRSAKSCTYYLSGKGLKKKLVASSKVKKGKSAMRLQTTSLKPGGYRVQANCGKAGHGHSGKFTVTSASTNPKQQGTTPPVTLVPVPPPPDQPPVVSTCQVAEVGGRYNASQGEASGGVRVANSSTNDAAGVQVTMSFWANGTLVDTASQYLERIPAGQSAYLGFQDVEADTDLTQISASATCASETAGPVKQVVGGSATSSLDEFGDLEVKGQFTNTYPFLLSSMARIDYVTRGADGQINGGGFTYPDDTVAQGSSATWVATNASLASGVLPAAIDFTVEPVAE